MARFRPRSFEKVNTSADLENRGSPLTGSSCAPLLPSPGTQEAIIEAVAGYIAEYASGEGETIDEINGLVRGSFTNDSFREFLELIDSPAGRAALERCYQRRMNNAFEVEIDDA